MTTETTINAIIDTEPDGPLEAQIAAQMGRIAKTAKERHTPEAEAAYNAERDKALRAETTEYLASKEVGCPKRQLSCESLDRLGEWGQTFENLSSKLGKGFTVALIGIRGSGKTQIAVELMRVLALKKKRVRYSTAMEFFMRVKATYKADSSSTEMDVIAEFTAPALLVIDELGQRSENDWENRLLYELLNRRYNALKDTLIISNQERETLVQSLGPSLVSRMNETGGIIMCNWKSYR